MWLRSQAPYARGKAVSVAVITFRAGGPALYVFEREELVRLRGDFAAFRRSGEPEGGAYRGRELRPYGRGLPVASPEAVLTLTFAEIYSIA